MSVKKQFSHETHKATDVGKMPLKFSDLPWTQFAMLTSSLDALRLPTGSWENALAPGRLLSAMG